MRTLVRHSALFLVLFLSMAMLFDLVLEREFIFRDPNANTSKIRRLSTSNDPEEIPVFGSSKGRSGFIPDTLGATVFNYAMEKCNYDVIELLLDMELAKPRTSTVVIEFNHRFFVPSPEHTINTSTFIPNLDQPLVRDYLKRKGRWNFRFDLPGFRYFGSALEYVRSGFRESTGQRKIFSRGGLFMAAVPPSQVFSSQVNARRFEVEQHEDLEHRISHVEEAISIDERHKLRYLRLTHLFTEPEDRVRLFEAQLASRPDRNILIVVTPYHPSELAGVWNYDRMVAKFREWEARFPHVHVYNYAEMALPDDHFKNTSHLNLAGARAFSSALHKDAGRFLSGSGRL